MKKSSGRDEGCCKELKKKKKVGAVNLKARMKNSGVFMEEYRGIKNREKLR